MTCHYHICKIWRALVFCIFYIFSLLFRYYLSVIRQCEETTINHLCDFAHFVSIALSLVLNLDKGVDFLEKHGVALLYFDNKWLLLHLRVYGTSAFAIYNRIHRAKLSMAKLLQYLVPSIKNVSLKYILFFRMIIFLSFPTIFRLICA